HTHTEDCYETEEVLVCALEESEGHTHTEDCYETVLTCTLEEHTHTVACMSDETADVETADDWEATLPELTGVWAEDVAAVAESQLGYTESTANFTLDEDGETRRGYTRYGAWAGNEYGGWDAMFASFCLYYGGVSTEDFPESTGAYAWAVKLNECGLYAEAADCAPASGDLAFFDTDGDGKADRVGIVTGVDAISGNLTVIEGDCETDDGADAVAENTYAADDGTILGYGVLPEQETEEEAEEGSDEEGSDEEGADEEGSDEEGADEEGSDEEGADEEGSDEEGADEEGADEEGSDEEGADEVETETYTASADGVTVTVTAPVGALPEGAELSVALLDEDSDAYANAAEAIGYDGEDEDSGMAALDIAFHDGDGLKVEPSGAVTVSIDASALLPEDADAGTIEVQHLAETEDGVETVLVADASEDTEGTVDTETATIEFAVESFSTFTVTWSSTGPNNKTETTTLDVTVYVDGSEYTGTVSDVSLSAGSSVDLTTLLSSDDYTFSYATVVYNSGSTNEATAITYTKQGPNGSYTITTTSSSISNVSSISSVSVYYVSNTKDPSVSISAEETTTGYTLTATPSNFSGTDVSYTWTVDDTASASISGGGETATLTWASDVSDGTEVTVTVTATYTYEDGGGNTVTETATDTYTVYYGVADVTFTVVYPTSSGTSAAASGVTVYVYDSNGTLVDSGTTDSSGQVTFELSNGATYTVTTSNYTANNYTYSYSGSVTADATNGNVISLVRDTSSGKYEHIDIKQVIMTSTSSSLTLTGITSVVVYDSSGSEVYHTVSITENTSESNWQCHFVSAGSSSTTGNHSISFDTSYTVVITYTVTDTDSGDTYTYSVAIDSTTTYPEGSYYPVTAARAWQLYNYIYGTSYTSSTWASSQAYQDLANTGIDISGMTYFEVAIVLCDSWGDSRNGLDFALDIGSLLYLSAGWEPSVQKTYVNSSMASGDFTFNLYEADITEDGATWTLASALGSPVESVTNGAATADASGDSQSTVSFSKITYSTSDAGTYYYIISETQGDGEYVTYDGTIYGAKVVVAVTSSTSGTVTTYETTVTTTYYELTAITDGNGTVTGYTATEIDLSTSDGAVTFTNVYSSGVELPSTGGSGLWMYTLAGLTLCGGAGVLFFRRRRQG
ncbi:MAG: LPXTG cell wall anchor domain-containing protein, partial [Clostridiales bacterium]|nr:LPXTG cell wall anchor domain-containing protein [Clostridiales bacterium]